MKRFFAILLLAFSISAQAATTDAGTETNTSKPGVKYKSGKDINFEELVVQGQLQRPEISVVTGNTAQGTDGLLRLREHFLDRTAADIGEEIQ